MEPCPVAVEQFLYAFWNRNAKDPVSPTIVCLLLVL